ncbi:fructose bisphosphate aldolase [Marivita sp. XM-24bin2]|jgi:fructose-bisphosphate aldolase class I|uniref:fructose bisphosphate aldolase n=1 Tax=unclassified Marivita TaxID=2632480 RepID=UPI000D7B778E|nr:fructose bisphosphate aldolase [Marivita sp. XM-24bin2]MCR9110511.1 fructose bisphosphate aldolase [Paracoccaceae bacterium]PWL35235.1 MAG: fructose bisphosphate aldolase [Marivita sp. XM-24bin2]
MTDTAMADRIENGSGFIAALDQSGGSTPKALRLYGIEEDAYGSDAEMFALIHEMRCRIMTAPDFTSDKVLGAILFERTMRDTVEGVPVPTYLWENRGVVPFLKIDKGLEDKENGVQVMKPMPGLEALLADAKAMGVFGTKERSVIHEADANGIKAVVAQQFEVAKTVCAAGLVPIIEPEVDINSPTKAEAEAILKQEIAAQLDALGEGETVMLKLTIPTEDGLYVDLADHPKVLRVVALSGGYTTDDACERLARNPKMIASFSRALAEGLSKQQSDDEFNAALGANIDKIFSASK